jgi:NAD(P)-dependent dehydrogenase (short-subunit alcohol dehydrogenase family)
LAKTPLGRWGLPSEIAAAAVYLCSDAAGFMTGTDLVIDGGWTAQ